ATGGGCARARAASRTARRAGRGRADGAARHAAVPRQRVSPDRAWSQRRVPGSRRRRSRAGPRRASARERPVGAVRLRARSAVVSAAERDVGQPRRALDVREIESLRTELERRAADLAPARWNADPEEVQRSVAKLVLTLIEFLRQLFEKQAIRRMEEGTLDAERTKALGVAMSALEETIKELADRFGLNPADLNLDLGPLGRLK